MRGSEITGVTDAAMLREFIGGETRIGVDTEFLRERTYFAMLCLVQVRAGDSTLIIDPLELDSLEGIWDTLLSRSWVLHSGRQDIEVLYQAFGRMPIDVFDTQVAAALTGMAPQVGYAGLVKALFDIELPKSQTRADWSRRPLTPKMLEYAADDVLYLLEAHDRLCDELERRGRLDWAREDSALLLDPALYDIDPGAAIARLKAATNLRGRPRRAAVALARWREERAVEANRPRQWILKDSVLIDMAQKWPRNAGELAAIEGMAATTVRRSGPKILEMLAAAADGTDEYEPPGRPSESDKARMKAMQKVVAETARDLDIAAEVIAPRKDLSAMMLGDRSVRALNGWRRAVVGERLSELLD